MVNGDQDLMLLICKVQEQKSATFKENLEGEGT